jgi:crotonobetainyl-CoA:carnitine CoA-transferase CaiB-like acyl-CoA transferase
VPQQGSQKESAPGPLAGLRVLDLTWQIAGPYCTKLLADYGADVIKIERPESGDPSRAFPPFYHDTPNPEGSLHFLYLNTNKRSILLDLKSEHGRQAFLALAREADVVVENFRPGVIERLGIGWAALHALNPRLILTSISNFGQTGPNRDLAAGELVEYAMSGMMYFSGRQSREPLKHGLSQGQYSAGANAAYVTAALVYAQARGAAGQWIDVSIQEALAAELVMNEPYYAWMGGVQGRRLTGDGGLGDIMPAKDGHIVLQLGATLSWSAIVELLETPALGEERFSTPQGRALHATEMNELIGRSLKQRSKHELFEEAAKRRILFGVAQNPADLLACPQLNARGFWVSVDHPTTGPLPYPGEPVKMSATPWRLRRPAPLLDSARRAMSNGQRTSGEGGHAGPPLREARVGADLRVRLDTSGAHSPSTDAWETSGRAHTPDTRPPTPDSRPLRGVRVLDTSSVFAMPYAAAVMADLGAEVIKIEALHHLDQTRGAAWSIWPENATGLTPWDVGGPFCNLNRGKRSIALDLSKDAGRELFRDLVRTADVVIENNTARVMRGWGLDYPQLREIRPDIIMVSNTGYGHNSPWESYPVQGTALEPMTGICHFSGYIGDRPWKIAQSYPDFLAMWHALFCIMAGLRHRELTGEGQWLDVGMYQLNVSFLGEAILDYAANGRLGGRIGNRDHLGGVQGCYQTEGDDRWLVVGAYTDAQWRALLELLGPGRWTGTAPASLAEARERHDELDAVLAAWTSGRTREEAVDACRAAGLPAGPVNDNRDLLLDPHLRARGFYEWIEHEAPAVGLRPLIGRCFRLSETPLVIERPAPPLGEGNEVVFEDLLGIAAERYHLLVKETITGMLEPLAEPAPTLPIPDQLRTGRIRLYDPDYRAKLGLEAGSRQPSAVSYQPSANRRARDSDQRRSTGEN